MPVVAGAIVPHAPLLLPELESAEVADAAARIRDAVSRLSLPEVEAVVMISPHALKTGLYHSGSGSLAPMGRADIDVTVETADDLVHAAARASGLPLLDGGFDHGLVVPLRLRDWPPIVAVGIGENAVTPETLGKVTNAIESIEADVAVVASVNTSAGLLPRAPLTHLPTAEEAEARLKELLSVDVGALSSRALGIAQQGGSCAAGPLTIMGRLFEEQEMTTFAHEAPVGVGYLVAQTT